MSHSRSPDRAIWVCLMEGKEHSLEMTFPGDGSEDGHLLIDGHDVGPARVWDGPEAKMLDRIMEALDECLEEYVEM